MWVHDCRGYIFKHLSNFIQKRNTKYCERGINKGGCGNELVILNTSMIKKKWKCIRIYRLPCDGANSRISHKTHVCFIFSVLPTDDLGTKGTRGRLNIKMSSYQYWDSHYKDKTVWRPSHLYNVNPFAWKDGLYIETRPRTAKSPLQFPMNIRASVPKCV